MTQRMHEAVVGNRDLTQAEHRLGGSGPQVPEEIRPTYVPPRLERLGAWRALTLQQTIPIG